MISRAMSAEEVAAELGYSKSWVYENWKRLVAEGKLPPPLHEAGHLVWSKAQVWAYLDRSLPKDMRALTAAHRAALEAASVPPAKRYAEITIEQHRAELDREFDIGSI